MAWFIVLIGYRGGTVRPMAGGGDKVSMKNGEIWKVRHNSKGEFTCKLMEDVPEGGGDVDVEIVDGTARFKASDAARAGDVIRMRTSMVEFLERLK